MYIWSSNLLILRVVSICWSPPPGQLRTLVLLRVRPLPTVARWPKILQNNLKEPQKKLLGRGILVTFRSEFWPKRAEKVMKNIFDLFLVFSRAVWTENQFFVFIKYFLPKFHTKYLAVFSVCVWIFCQIGRETSVRPGKSATANRQQPAVCSQTCPCVQAYYTVSWRGQCAQCTKVQQAAVYTGPLLLCLQYAAPPPPIID